MPDPRDDLMAVDRAFNDLAQREGRRAAFLHYLAPGATMYRDGREPIVGGDAIAALFPPDAPGVLRWEPTSADVGAAGDLGYTLGKWEFEAPAADGTVQVSRGFYVTIWKRQPDGAWKYVFDSGVEGPPGR